MVFFTFLIVKLTTDLWLNIATLRLTDLSDSVNWDRYIYTMMQTLIKLLGSNCTSNSVSPFANVRVEKTWTQPIQAELGPMTASHTSTISQAYPILLHAIILSLSLSLSSSLNFFFLNSLLIDFLSSKETLLVLYTKTIWLIKSTLVNCLHSECHQLR